MNEPRARQELVADARAFARVVGTITFVGVLAGWFTAGVLSRLAMFVLVELNPVADGLTSDDGFEMGRFTLSGSLNLLFLVGTLFGVLGAGLYVALRRLAIGPAWFRVLSMSLGAGTVVGSQIIHVDGVDFALLDPLWLAVSLFIAVPAVFVALVAVVGERLLARGDALPRPVVVLGLAAWVVAFPLLPLLAAIVIGWLVARKLGSSESGRRLLASPIGPWTVRLALAAVFCLGVIDVVRDVQALT